MERDTHNPNATPVATTGLSTAKLFLFKGIESKLEQIENAPNPNVKKQWKDYELLRLWTRRYKQTGFSPWPATVFATCCVVAGALWLHAHWPTETFYNYPDHFLRVIQKVDDQDFYVQRVDAGKPQEITLMKFCEDSVPYLWIEGGHSFSWIRYNHFGTCESLAPNDRGFDVIREDTLTFVNGKWRKLPILAPNCHFDWSTPDGHVVGDDGKPCKPNFN